MPKPPGRATGGKRVAAIPATTSGTQTIQRASMLVRLVASRSSRTGVRLADVVQFSGLQRPTAHRILKCLIEEGFLMQDESHHYRLGPLIFELGLAAAPQFNLCDICRPSLQRIAEKTGDTVFLSVRSGYDSVCIDRKEGGFPIKALTLETGVRRPLGVGAGGLSLLLNLSEEETDEIVRANARRLGGFNLTVPVLLQMLRRSRQLGYALNDSHVTAVVTTLGVPIVNRYGHPFAAISMSAISSRMSYERQIEVVTLLREEIALIERALQHVTQP